MAKVFQKVNSFLKLVHPLEIIVLVAIFTAVSFYQLDYNAGILDPWYYMYIVLIFFISSFYGKVPGILTIIASLFGIMSNLIAIHNPPDITAYIDSLVFNNESYEFTAYIFGMFLVAVIFGEIRDTLGATIHKEKNTNEMLIDRISKMQQEIDALTLVNEEYQDRILGQQNSLISLYSTMISLNTLDLDSIYPNILDAIVKFTGASTCSLWKYERDEHNLTLISTYGWDEEKKLEMMRISDSDNLNGWVARNNTIFSIKMLQKYKNLQELDKKENIITLPITIENRVWGVINIESMPFIKYNLYSERLSMMIADLATPVIENALRYTELTKKGEVDPVTGLHALDELFIVMKDEFDNAVNNNLNISFAIIDLTNHEVLLEHYSEKDVLGLLKDISQLVIQDSKGQAKLFQYKETYQFSMVLTNMDHDGAAMFCLNIIELHSKHIYKIGNDQVRPEILVGYSSRRENHRSEEDLMFLAENLLMMQKI